MADRDELIDQWCEVMHKTYEVAALDAGWETQTRSRVPWSEVPEANKMTMRAAVAAIEPLIRADERAKIITSLRRNRIQRPPTEYQQGYRDGITDTIGQIEKEGTGG